MPQEPRSILITGCSSGIGLCAAEGLNARGYRVFATARHQTDVDRLNGMGLESLQLDLDDSDSIDHAVSEILRRTDGRLYALFNNGAFGLPGAVEDLSRDALRAQFETNFFGWAELTNHIIPVMRAQGEGRIIYNSSVLGFIAMPFRGAYTSSKYAVEGLADTLRLELAGSNIHISLIEPGPILSKFRKNALICLEKFINIDKSIHRDRYTSVLSRLKKEGPAVPFTLPPEAVLDKLIHALEKRRPRARYPVTVPSHLFYWLKRLISIRSMDWLLRRAGSDGKR